VRTGALLGLLLSAPQGGDQEGQGKTNHLVGKETPREFK
jgi:hypothetical protein